MISERFSFPITEMIFIGGEEMLPSFFPLSGFVMSYGKI